MSESARPIPVLDLWTVYDHPRDAPQFVRVRCWHLSLDVLNKSEPLPGHVVDYHSLEAARDALRRRGLVPIGRDATDDPVIVESWV